ncbi:hypothetical protein BDZ89DRAFT_1134870 [Hymenopellis radicata]|nr:hypothetical protein BDZ89DRAFT_1134870 [Hymenopellis radicata]
MCKKTDAFPQCSDSMGARFLARLITSLPIVKVDVVPALSEARLPVTRWSETSADAAYPFQSAAQTLPCELVCLIFSFLDWYSPRRLAPGVYGPFWAATHVCHQWREALRGEAPLVEQTGGVYAYRGRLP